MVVAMRGKLWVMCGAFRLLHMRVFDMLVLTCFPKTGRCLSTLLSATVNIQTECQRTLAWCPGCASHGVNAGCLLSRGRQHQTPLLRVVNWCYLTI